LATDKIVRIIRLRCLEARKQIHTLGSKVNALIVGTLLDGQVWFHTRHMV